MFLVGNSNKWMKALWELNAGVEANKICVALGDVHDGHHSDYHFVLVDESQVPNRLRLYKGLTPIAESVLADIPVGIVNFVSDPGQTDSSCLAIAFSAYLLIYRNMKPYYRYNIPQMDILEVERDVWKGFRNGKLSQDDFLNALKHLQEKHSLRRLSFQSQQLLTLTDADQYVQLLERLTAERSEAELRNVQIACLTKMARHSSPENVVDVLIVGTELSSIYFVDSQAYTVLHHTSIGVTPTKMIAMGTYDVEFRLIVCTREHDVFIVRRNSKGVFLQHSFYVREYPFDVIACKNQVVFATRKRRLIYFSVKGKRQSSVQFNEDITDIESFYYEPRQYNGVLVAIGTEVRLYLDQLCVDAFHVDRPIEWLKFGRMVGEEGVLVIAMQGGGLGIKIFRRVATLNESSGQPKFGAGKVVEFPKKSKVFVEQSLREQENPQTLHQIYQRDWFMIKYHTAKTFADLESGRTKLLPIHDTEPFQITYDVLGFGPQFRIIVRLSVPIKVKTCRRWLFFIADAKDYEFGRRIIELPTRLPAGRWLPFAVTTRCLRPERQRQPTVKIVLSREQTRRPIWVTTFEMPLSEPDIG